MSVVLSSIIFWAPSISARDVLPHCCSRLPRFQWNAQTPSASRLRFVASFPQQSNNIRPLIKTNLKCSYLQSLSVVVETVIWSLFHFHEPHVSKKIQIELSNYFWKSYIFKSFSKRSNFPSKYMGWLCGHGKVVVRSHKDKALGVAQYTQ